MFSEQGTCIEGLDLALWKKRCRLTSQFKWGKLLLMQVSFFVVPSNGKTPDEFSLFSCTVDHTSIITLNSTLDLLTHGMAE